MGDIRLTIDSVPKDLNLVRDKDGKAWKVASKSYVEDDEANFIQNDWVGGFGQGNWTERDRYNDGQNIDTTHAQRFFLGPKITSATDIGRETLGFAEFATNLYVYSTSQLYLRTSRTELTAKWPDDWAVATAYSEGDYIVPTTANDYIYECTTAGTSDAATEPTWGTTLDGTTADNGTLVWTCRQITHAKEFAGNLYIACGDGKYVYTSDVSTFTVTDLTQDNMDKFAVMPSPAADVSAVMWGFKSPSTAYSSADPAASGTEWSSYTVGDTSADITNLMLIADKLVVGREDGLVHIATDSSLHPWLPELEIAESANNFKHFCHWQACLYFSVCDDIGELTKNESYQTMGPYNEKTMTEFEITGECCGLTADRNWIYAFMDDGTNTVCYKGRERYKGNGLVWEWTPWINLSTNACDAAYVYQPSSGSTELWFGYGDTPSSVLLSDNPLADTAYKVCSSGYLITGWFDAGARPWGKLIEAINVECYGWDIDGQTVTALSSNVKVTISYEADESGTFTSIGTYNATNNKTLSLKKYLTAVTNFKKIRFKIQLDSNDDTRTPVVKTFASYGHMRPDNLKVYDLMVYCGVKDKQAKTIRDFVETGRDSTGLVTLNDPLGTDVYVLFQPGYPIEKMVDDEGAKQPVVAMHIKATEVDWS